MTSRRLGLRTSLLLAFVSVYPAALCAQPGMQPHYDDRAREIHNQLNGINDQIADITRQISRIDKQIQDARDKQKTAQTDIDAATKTVTTRRAELQATTTQQAAVNEQLASVTRKLTKDFESAPTFTTTQKAVDDARKAADDAKQRALTPLRSTADYKAAQAALDQAKAKLEQVKAEGPGQPDAFATASKELLDRDSAIAKLEQKALDSDASYKTAKATFDKSMADLAAQRAVLQTQLRTDPDRLVLLKQQQELSRKEATARVDLQRASEKLAQAKGDLARAEVPLKDLEDQKSRREDTRAGLERRSANLQAELRSYGYN